MAKKSFDIRIPTELRITIYELVSEGYQKQRVHRIDSRPSNPRDFISNQPYSLLLHMSQGCRREYLKKSESTMAFGTYVSYERDIFYFTDNRGPDDILRLAMFFNSRDARLVKKFAISHWLFQVVNDYLLDSMNGLEEVMIVWEEWRPWEERWLSKVVIKKDEGKEEITAASQD